MLLSQQNHLTKTKHFKPQSQPQPQTQPQIQLQTTTTQHVMMISVMHRTTPPAVDVGTPGFLYTTFAIT